MSAPFFRFGLFNAEVSLVVAFLIGIGFGFFLERAGFCSARKLTAQFYFKDLAVLKVMFTAIITAMTGLYVVSRLGLVDLSLVYLTPTFLVPQIAGGLLLGVGFVIGGYCPGTSVVSASIGRMDAVVFLAGMFAGLIGFGAIYPAIASFTTITSLGTLTLPAVLQLPYGVVVLAVVVMAVGAFVAAEWAEKRIGGVTPGADSLLGAVRPLNAARGLAAALLVIGVIAAVAGNPYRDGRVAIHPQRLADLAGTPAQTVSATELSRWMVEGRADYLLLDVRAATDYARNPISGAHHVPFAKLGEQAVPRTEKILLYGKDDEQATQAWRLLKAQGYRSVYTLVGGLEAWNRDVMSPAKPADDAPEAVKAEFAARAAVARFLGGTPEGETASAMKTRPVFTPAIPVQRGVPAAMPARKMREGC